MKRVLRPLQPALGLRETPEPHQHLAGHGEGRRGDRVGGPAVGLGDRDRLLAALKRDGGRASSEQSGHGQVGEAADLQVGPLDSSRKREPLLEVALRLGKPNRPELGDAEVHQRRRPVVVAEGDVARGPCLRGRLERLHRLRGGLEITLPAGQREPHAGPL